MATTPLLVSMDLPLQDISCDVASLSCLLHPCYRPCCSLAHSIRSQYFPSQLYCDISFIVTHSARCRPSASGEHVCGSFYVDVCFHFSTSGHATYGNSTFSILINCRTMFPKGLPDFTYAGVSPIASPHARHSNSHGVVALWFYLRINQNHERCLKMMALHDQVGFDVDSAVKNQTKPKPVTCRINKIKTFDHLIPNLLFKI